MDQSEGKEQGENYIITVKHRVQYFYIVMRRDDDKEELQIIRWSF